MIALHPWLYAPVQNSTQAGRANDNQRPILTTRGTPRPLRRDYAEPSGHQPGRFLDPGNSSVKPTQLHRRGQVGPADATARNGSSVRSNGLSKNATRT